MIIKRDNRVSRKKIDLSIIIPAAFVIQTNLKLLSSGKIGTEIVLKNFKIKT